MKKILWIAAAVAGLFAAASCQKEAPQSGVNGETANVTLSVQTPAVQTRTISDGKKANIVHWAAFDNNDKPVAGLAGTAVINGMKAEIEVTLVKHYDYNFVFWAHVGDEYGQNAAYGLSTFNEDGKVVVNYGGNANDENRDAFYANQIITIVSDNEVKEVQLYRPFAQINFLAADYKDVEAVGLNTNMTSTILMEGLPSVLNGIDGTVDKDAAGTTVNLAKYAIPSEDKYYTITDPATGVATTYGWYSMNYILATDKDTKDVTGLFYHDKKVDGVSIEVNNVPYERNHRTNIIGNFFTEKVKVQLIVVEGFDDEYIETYPQI